jgi:transmembrane sensor
MKLNEINTIISKFIDNEATSSEKAFLMEWIEEGNNKIYFEDFVTTDIWIKYNFDIVLVEEQLASLSIIASPKIKGTRKIMFAYAGYSALLIALFLFFYLVTRPILIPILDVNTISLEVNEGTPRYDCLADLTNSSIDDSSVQFQKNGVLTYHESQNADKEARSEIYHTLHLPYDKTFEVHFSDESSTSINAGSQLLYPKNFDADDTGQISPDGETYFKISKSNELRNRAGLEPIDASKSETFTEKLLSERPIELAFENHCWADIKRIGVVVEKLTEAESAVIKTRNIRNLFFIPQREMNINANFAQNNN